MAAFFNPALGLTLTPTPLVFEWVEGIARVGVGEGAGERVGAGGRAKEDAVYL
jgi:hypothetical protein